MSNFFKNNLEEFSIYIHIPFCISKCKYCDFNSYSDMDNYIEEYIHKTILDIENSKYFIGNKYLCKTIYFGGGTPSYIDEKYISMILETIKSKYNIDKKAEITIEVNPSSVTEGKIKKYLNVGFNRISIGLQSTNNEILSIIGRKHTYEMFLDKYSLIKENGFDNINIDLMIGLPNQKIADVKSDIMKVINLNPAHISCYSLILYENTKLYQEISMKKYSMPTDEQEREMYYLIQNTLKENGFNQYEISNFSKEGFESKHNTLCWEQKQYLGFGAGAHSFIENKRMYYEENIEKYMNTNEMIVEEDLTKIDLMKEYMILGLRLIDGINKKEFENKFNEKVDIVFKAEIEILLNKKLILSNENNIKLTKLGLDFANIVWEEFV